MQHRYFFVQSNWVANESNQVDFLNTCPEMKQKNLFFFQRSVQILKFMEYDKKFLPPIKF